jgi:hypothetical protein
MMDALFGLVAPWLTADNLVVLLLAAGTCFFSALAVRAQRRMWQRVGRSSWQRQQQRFITQGRAHLR